MPVKFQHVLCLALTLQAFHSTSCLASTEKQATVTSAQVKKQVSANEEQVSNLRRLAADNPDKYLPQLITAINQQGVIYHKESRFQQAHLAYEEALELCHKADEEKAEQYQGLLYMLLNNQALLYQAEKNWPQAILFYEKAVAISRLQVEKDRDAYLPQLTSILHGQAQLYKQQNLLAEALTAYSEAISNYRQLIKKDADTYTPRLAKALFYVGMINHLEKKFADAKKNYEESVAFYRIAIAKDSKLNAELALTLSNVGMINKMENKKPEARLAFDESIALYKADIQNNPASLYGYGVTLDGFGELNAAENKLPQAQAAYEDAINIYRQIKDADLAFIPLTSTLSNLGDLYRQSGQGDKARSVYEEAASNMRKLAITTPDPYMMRLARTRLFLGLVYLDARKNLQAQQAFEEAINLYRGYIEKYPELATNLAAAYTNLGDLADRNIQPQQAYAAYSEALALYRKLAKQDPDIYVPPLTRMLTNLAELDNQKNRNNDALAKYEEAAVNYRKLSEKNAGLAELYAAKFAKVLTNLGYINLAKRPGLAEVTLNEAATLYRSVVVKNPVFLHDFAITQINLGVAYKNQNKLADGRKTLEEAAENYHKLMQKNPELASELILVLSHLGEISIKEVRFDDARKIYAELITLHRQQSEKYPAADRRKLAWTINKLGTLVAINKDLAQARVLLNEAISIYRQEAEKHAELFPDLAISIYSLGLIEQEDKKFANALKAFEDASAVLHQQKQLRPDQQNELANVLGSLTAMEFLNGKKKEAQDHVNEALLIRRRLVKDQPEMYSQDLIAMLLQQSSIHVANQDRPKAREVYEEIMELAKHSPPLAKNTQLRLDMLKTYISALDKQ